MASFSDDEQMFEVDSVLDQRKRKGVLEYLVQWKGAESGQDKSWEPATKLAESCATLISSFIKSKTKKRSQSKTRKGSRSRSRSTSRGRKAKTEKVAVRRSTRSTSRGRASKIPISDKKPEEEISEEKKSVEISKPSEAKPEEIVEKSISQVQSVAVSQTETVAQVSQTETVAVSQTESVAVSQTEAVAVSQTESAAVSQTVSAAVSQSESVSSFSTTTVSSTVTSSSSLSSSESSTMEKNPTSSPTSDRVLRSATKKKEELEVQRVHTELRPVHKDDGKPRSSVWKVADYMVIALFVISVIAAIFLFVEKFMDLKDFKPSLITLQSRLSDMRSAMTDRASGAWLSLMDLVGSGATKK